MHIQVCPLAYTVAACTLLTHALQGEYGSTGLEAAYNGGQAAFAAAYGGQAGYPASAAGTSGKDAYGSNVLYSQGFASASQVGMVASNARLFALQVSCHVFGIQGCFTCLCLNCKQQALPASASIANSRTASMPHNFMAMQCQCAKVTAMSSILLILLAPPM